MATLGCNVDHQNEMIWHMLSLVPEYRNFDDVGKRTVLKLMEIGFIECSSVLERAFAGLLGVSVESISGADLSNGHEVKGAVVQTYVQLKKYIRWHAEFIVKNKTGDIWALIYHRELKKFMYAHIPAGCYPVKNLKISFSEEGAPTGKYAKYVYNTIPDLLASR